MFAYSPLDSPHEHSLSEEHFPKAKLGHLDIRNLRTLGLHILLLTFSNTRLPFYLFSGNDLFDGCC